MLSLEGVGFAYGGSAPVLEEVTACFPRGEITGVIGPNGCGKSTLLGVAAGLLPAGTGSVRLEGRDLYAMRPRERAKKIALLRQHQHGSRQLAEDVVLAGRYPHRGWGMAYSGGDRALAVRAMARTGCGGLAGKPMDRLSGGERQRVWLAAALAQETDIILLDEPTTYLDVNVAMEIMELITRLNREEGKTIVMVLHDLHLALHYSHRVLLLERGRAVQQGTPKEIVAGRGIEQVFRVELKQFESGGRSYFQCGPARRSCYAPPPIL